MKLWVVELPFDEPTLGLPDHLFQRALKLVDQETQAKVKKFYKQEDAWRSLTGKLLPRYMIHRLGHDPAKVKIRRTDAGKPFITNPKIAFNISHDSSMVVLAFDEQAGSAGVGVDVMSGELPYNETYGGFVDALDEQLSPYEKAYLRSRDEDATKDIYWIWTMKEAYTKALGLGLGFDFKRISFNLSRTALSVDQRPVTGWGLWMLELRRGYQCCIAKTGTGGEASVIRGGLPEIEYIDIQKIVDGLS